MREYGLDDRLTELDEFFSVCCNYVVSRAEACCSPAYGGRCTLRYSRQRGTAFRWL